MKDDEKLSFEEFKQQYEESLSKKLSSELDSYFLRDPNSHMDILLKGE